MKETQQILDQLKSNEEIWFFHYLLELKDAGFIFSIKYEPCSFSLGKNLSIPWTKTTQLKTKVKEECREGKLVRSREYTPDFLVGWTPKAKGVFFYDSKGYVGSNLPMFYAHNFESYIEVKADFDRHNMTRAVGLTLSWVFAEHDEYIQLVKVPSLFKKTFYPEAYFLTKKGEMRTKRKDGSKVLLKDTFEWKSLKHYI